MDVSVILVGYRNFSLMADCLESLYQHTKSVVFEVIVVNNSPDKAAQAAILQRFSEVRWVEMGYNAGFSRANNVGIALAKGKYVLLLNADTLLLDNDVLLHCVFRLNHRPDITACSVQQLNRLGQTVGLYHSFAFRRWFYIHPSWFNKPMEWLIPENKYHEPSQVDWLSGAFLMVRKTAIQEAGCMDEDFFLYAEDVEWCGRLGKTGKLMYYQDLDIVHLENEANPHRPAEVSFVNRFSTQVQLSNLLWVRKQFGVVSYLTIMLNYLSLIPIFFAWKYLRNLLTGKSLGYQLENQRAFAYKTKKLMQYFWDVVFLRHKLYKID